MAIKLGCFADANHSLKKAIDRATYEARVYGRPTPVIRSDSSTLLALGSALAEEIGCSLSDLRQFNEPGSLFMYDGVRFEIDRSPPVAVTDAWREHFGPLTEIYN
jgi:hypothetical protein